MAKTDLVKIFAPLLFFFTECRDLGANCDRTRVLCTHPGYASFMKQNCKATCGYCSDQTDYGESSYLPRFSSLFKARVLFISEGQKNKKFICFK